MLSVSVFRGLLVVIVTMIEGSEKIICHLSLEPQNWHVIQRKVVMLNSRQIPEMRTSFTPCSR